MDTAGEEAPHSGYVVQTSTTVFRQSAPVDSDPTDDRLVFLGTDSTGRLLEVMAVELKDNTLLIIHAMPMRAKYRRYLEDPSDE